MERLHNDLRELLELFNSNGVEFLIVGGHAVAFHGHPRFTEDIDCFVRPSEANGARIVQALQTFGFGSVAITAADFAASDRMIQLGRAPNCVDLLTRLSGVTFEDAWATKVQGRIDRLPVWLIDREALIANKRATGRPQDLVDAEAIASLEPES